ncbi:MAG: TldD/PmbA family protein [Pseudomonadota bacterium]
MIDEIPFDKIIQAAIGYGADFAEVFVERNRQSMITCDNKKMEYAGMFNDAGIGIRVIKDGLTAYGSTNDLTRKSLLALAKNVGKMARAKKAKAGKVTLTEKRGEAVATVRKHPYGISLDEKCNVVMRANDIAWQAGEEVKQVRISYRDVVRRIWIAASDGVFSMDEQVGTLLSTHVVAGDGSVLQTGQETIGGAMGFEIFTETPPEEVADKAASRAIRMLKARPAPAGMMPVLLSSEAGGTMIHEAVGHGLEADLAGEGLSVYSNKIGQKVASDLITVVDDATLAGKQGSFTFDDEGTLAQRTVLIEKGILKTYMSDRRSAQRLGIARTGNGRRQSYEDIPVVRMTNTLVLPGNHDPEAILKDTPFGLFVKRMGGGQVKTVNGDFVFEVQEGYLIEDSCIGEPVRGATIIGNGPKILNIIDRVGTDLGFSVGTCGKDGQDAPVSCGQPTIRIPEIVVGGTE